MNTKRGKKSNLENASSVNNKRKTKNQNPEVDNVMQDTTLQQKESVPQSENKVEIKVGRKRKQTNGSVETPAPKKVRKKNKDQAQVKNIKAGGELSMSSSINQSDSKEMNSSATAPKRAKKKSKISDGSLMANQNSSSVNVPEIPIQQNGKRKEREKTFQNIDASVGEISFHNVDGELVCKEETGYSNIKHEVNINDEKLDSDNIVNISIQDLEETDSDLNENDILVQMGNKIGKVITPTKAAKDKEELTWPREDLKKLVDRMEACIPDNDVLAFTTRAEKLQWDTVVFKNYTVEDCKKTWNLLQKQIRRFRLLKEVLVDAKEWINSPKTRSKKPARHPDMPRKPLTAYFIYYLKKKDVFHKAHPGLDATEISKTLGQEFKNLPPEKRVKYENLAAKKKQEYEQKLDEFYKAHPEIPRIAKGQKVSKNKPLKSQKLPKGTKPSKLPKPIKGKAPPKPPKERIPKRPPAPFQYYYLSELEKQSGQIEDKLVFKETCKEGWKELSDQKKLTFINCAEAEYAKYEEALKQYIQSHPGSALNLHKPSLSKEEIQIKERVAGKPSKPPGSAYNLFARMLLQSDEIKNVPVKDRLIFVSNQWKNCMEEEKKQYKDLSARLNEKYKLDFASYLETLPEEEKKRELEKTLPKQRKSEEVEKKVSPKKKKKPQRKAAIKKLVEPEQPPISAFKYFATLYTGEEPVAKAWKALTPEQKKIYEDELVKKKQAYIVDFEKFLKSLTKEELEAFSISRKKIKEKEEADEEEESSDESGTEDSEAETDDSESEEEDDK